MRATWYILEDGSTVDPAECSPDKSGALAHKSGVKVKMRSHDCAMTTGVDVDEAAPKPAVASVKTPVPAPAKTTTEMRPAPAPKQQAKKPGYKTRKAR